MAIPSNDNLITIVLLGIFGVALILIALFMVILCCGFCCCSNKSVKSPVIQSSPKKTARRNRFVLIGDCLWHKNHANGNASNFVTPSATSSQSSNSSRLPLYTDGVNHSLTSEYELYAGNEYNNKQYQWQKNLVAATNRDKLLRHSFPYPQQRNSLDNSSDYYSSILLLSSAGSGNYLPPQSPHPLPPPYGLDCQIACAPYLMQRSSSGIERNIRPPSFTAPPPPSSLPPAFYKSESRSSNFHKSPTIL